MKLHYDLIFGLGRTCICTQALRKAKLQFASFPWDWVGNPPISERIAYVCTGFKDWPRCEDLEWRQKPQLFDNKKHVVCRRTGLFFLHDFKPDLSLEEQYPVVAEKYARRIKRLYDLLASSKRVLIVSIDNPFLKDITSMDECRQCREAMSARFKGIRFDFLQMTVDPGRPFDRRIEDDVEDGLFHVSYDYRKLPVNSMAGAIQLEQVSGYLASRFSVRDYRTKEAKASYAKLLKARRERRLCRRMEDFGASNRLQYELYRLRKTFRSIACAIGPRSLLARVRQKKFDNVVFLGSNCEAAFRFLRRWGFVDSSLFAWSSTTDLPTLTAALDRIDDIPDGTFEFKERSRVWKSVETNTYHHGRLKIDEGGSRPSPAELDQDLADMRGRLRHLVDKFRRYVSSSESTLLVLRLSDVDASASNVQERLRRLWEALARLGAQNCSLLVVCRRSDLVRMPPESDGLFIRCVREFNTPDYATRENTGDPVGWSAIFTEFAPAKILPKAHAFKFEQAGEGVRSGRKP